jgi:signal transduction histidine kinase
MSTAASSEFMALCRAQLQLLAESLGASRSIVYLSEGLDEGGESKLLPVVVYPDTEIVWSKATIQIAPQLLAQPLGTSIGLVPPQHSQPKQVLAEDRRARMVTTLVPAKPPARVDRDSPPDEQSGRLVLPLVHDGTIVGLLMTTREAHPWNATEQTEIQHIAQTLALAGILDLRRNWLTSQLQQQKQIQLQQQDLLHNLLHQLRNPLTAIRTFGKLLIKRLQPEDRDRSIATSIVRESDRLQDLLQHLEIAIDFNLVGDVEIEPDSFQTLPADDRLNSSDRHANLLLPDADFRLESCQLTDVLDPLILSAEAIAQDRNLTFYTHIPRDLPLVRASAAALREVLSNLIDNALKYTPAGGEIDIDVELGENLPGRAGEESQPTLQICIRDTGMGIPPQDLEKLFTRHYRGVQAQGSISGTGLGLAIAKELVTHMNGQIEAISPPPGSDRGTEFMLQLQLVKLGASG